MPFGAATLSFTVTKGEIYITGLETTLPERRKGHAKKLLRLLCVAADNIGYKLRLKPEPMRDRKVSAETLREIYKKFGFEGDLREMIRMPKQANVGRATSVPSPGTHPEKSTMTRQ